MFLPPSPFGRRVGDEGSNKGQALTRPLPRLHGRAANLFATRPEGDEKQKNANTFLIQRSIPLIQISKSKLLDICVREGCGKAA